VPFPKATQPFPQAIQHIYLGGKAIPQGDTTNFLGSSRHLPQVKGPSLITQPFLGTTFLLVFKMKAIQNEDYKRV
jgi:hypothetical protein